MYLEHAEGAESSSEGLEDMAWIEPGHGFQAVLEGVRRLEWRATKRVVVNFTVKRKVEFRKSKTRGPTETKGEAGRKQAIGFLDDLEKHR